MTFIEAVRSGLRKYVGFDAAPPPTRTASRPHPSQSSAASPASTAWAKGAGRPSGESTARFVNGVNPLESITGTYMPRP